MITPNRAWPVILLLLFLACSCGESKKPEQPLQPQQPQQPAGPKRAFANRIAGVTGVENFAKINANLYRGAQPEDDDDEDGYKSLADMGIKTVINLREYIGERDEVEGAGMKYVEIPLQAGVLGSEPPTDDQLKLFFDTVLDPQSWPVYFHCAHGKDRTGTMAALYRIEIDGWTAKEAMEEMQYFGYHDIYEDLIKFVEEYKPRGFARKEK
ncbi:MAG: tyrosine-protein phosphatase [Planctomycetota bacterium]|nr:tyrosine-protein phosphatase [Planctomycetota bacterium]